MTGKSIKVKIFGTDYPLRGENEDFTKKVASHVDSMLNRIHDKIPEQPPLTVAVLTALNITEEMLKERDQQLEAVDYLEAEITKLSEYLDDCLRPESGSLEVR
ncbi:MAG TPA: cell division protein ZapA [Bacteroidota bacterium]